MRLSELEADAQIDVPRVMGARIQEMARTFPDVADWIVHQLCGKDRISFRPVPNLDLGIVMAFNDGARSRGVLLHRIINTPITEPESPPEPPARTATEKVRRRNKSTPTQG